MGLKVHVTGGKGFLGRYIQEAFAAPGADPVELEISDVDTLDVTNQQAVIEAMKASKPDVVVHLAGLMGAGDSLRDPRQFFEVNCVGTLNVLEACRQAEVGGIVFMSSLTVHGQTSDDAVDEDSSMLVRHPYAGSKASAEFMVQTYARCFGVKAAILRATLIAGEGQKEPNAIGDFVEACRKGEDIEIYGEGTHRREWLHPSDLAASARVAVDKVAATEGTLCETYIISSGEGISMRDLAQKIIDRMGTGTLTFQPSTRQAFDLVSTPTKMRDELGWSPAMSVDDIIEAFIQATEPNEAKG